MLSDIFDDEVIVSGVIPAKHKPSPVAKPRAGAATTSAAAAAKPVSPVRASARAAVAPADSIFKVKNRPAPTKASPAAPATPPTKRPVVVYDAPIEDMDSTQTLRALTPLELSDDTQSKWFAVQLALTEEPVKIESIPHIDIFDEYRLYSISGIDQGSSSTACAWGSFLRRTRRKLSRDICALRLKEPRSSA